MGALTRRQLLERLSATCTAAAIGSQKKDWFDRERVCIHIFNALDVLPVPLLEKPGRPPGPRGSQTGFQIGLPELVLCTTRAKFLEMFRYFWPFTRPEFQQLLD